MGKPPLIYTDNNATTQVSDEAREAMLPFLGEGYGNPSSVYALGGKSKAFIDQARGRVAALIGADPSEIVFTSCGTESNHTAIWGVLESYPQKRHIITSSVEHLSLKAHVAALERKGYRVTWLPVNSQGRLDLEDLMAALQEDTAIVSLMWANNETGVFFPVQEAARILKERGVVMHVDAVQAIGKTPINMKNSSIDLLSISGHKFHAPKGVGALYVRRGTRLRPLLWGGHQERGRRAGTENVPGIVGLGVAAEQARANLQDVRTRVKALRDRLEEGILKTCPEAQINGDPENRIPNTTNISFRFIQGESILLALDEHQICASTGSACTTGQVEPSHVLRAMDVPFTYEQGSVRFSLSRYSTDEEIDQILETLPKIVRQLRELSPFTEEEKAPDTTL